MNVSFKESFAKDLRGIVDKSLLRRIREVIEAAERNQTLNELTGIKKLKGGGNYFRIRVGDYRIGLVLDGETLVFVRCLNRNEIYRYFP